MTRIFHDRLHDDLGFDMGEWLDACPLPGEVEVEPLDVREALMAAHNQGNQYNAQSTVLCNGNIVICWQDFEQRSGVWRILARCHDAQGKSLSDVIRVSPKHFPDPHNPSVTALCSGGFVITWQSYSGLGDISKAGIYGQRFDAVGEFLGEILSITDAQAPGYQPPQVSTLRDGGFVVTWDQQDMSDGSCCKLKQGRRYDPQGATLSESFRAQLGLCDPEWQEEEALLARVVENNYELTGYSINHLTPNGRPALRVVDVDHQVDLPLCHNHHRRSARHHPCYLHIQATQKK